MKVTIHQPDFLPWLGFFNRWRQSNLLIIYDDAQFIKGGWQNRDILHIQGKDHWLTVPVLTKGRLGQKINEVEINNEINWKSNHLNTFKTYFGKCKNFKFIFAKIEEVYKNEYEKLIDLNMDLLRLVADLLGIKTPLKFSSNYRFISTGTQKIIDLLKAEKATQYLTGKVSKSYLDEQIFKKENIFITYQELEDVKTTFHINTNITYSVVHYIFNSPTIKNNKSLFNG